MMFVASSIFFAYCNTFLANKEIGVAAPDGIADFAALRVTLIPSIFIPETTPVIPPQVIIINLCPCLGLQNKTILFSANLSPT